MSIKEQLPPNYGKLEMALRSIGYSFETAIADIIDNSIDAEAQNVLIRLLPRPAGHLDLAIWDDGHGMDKGTLREAMRFGADVSREIGRLGKFGLGLKLASLSQAREVCVVTARDNVLSGRAWLAEGIGEGFVSAILDETECRQLIEAAVPDRPSTPSGTVVLWSNLYRVRYRHNASGEDSQRLLQRLKKFLPLTFHRFLAGHPRKVHIALDIYSQDNIGIPVELDPLSPFAYTQTGHNAFPAQMLLGNGYDQRVRMTAHVWPPNSGAPEYKLPGGASARQGFYFYRNNRLIQGGGWNGLRETEPHSSLARLEIDLDADFDVDVSLDVKKEEIQLPHDLVHAIQHAKTSSGVDFRKYLSITEQAYRKRKFTDAELPVIPSDGLPAKLARFLHNELRIETTQKHRDLKIAWQVLEDHEFFSLDRETDHLYLNRIYRKQLLRGSPASSADCPVLKCLLFFVLEEAVSSERMGPRIRQRFDLVNRVLMEAVKYERYSG